MDVKTVTDFLIYLGAISAALVAIGTLMRYVAVRPLKAFVKNEVSPLLCKLEDIEKMFNDHIRGHP